MASRHLTVFLHITLKKNCCIEWFIIRDYNFISIQSVHMHFGHET